MIAEATTATPRTVKFGLALGMSAPPLIDLAGSIGGTTFSTAGGTITATETMAYPTAPDTRRGFNVKISQEDGIWLVVDRATGIFGSGDTAAEAVDDFRIAIRDHLETLEEEDALAEPLRWQLDYLRARIA